MTSYCGRCIQRVGAANISLSDVDRPIRHYLDPIGQPNLKANSEDMCMSMRNF